MVYLVTVVCDDEPPPLNLTKVCGKSPTILSLSLLLQFIYCILGNNIQMLLLDK